MQDEGTASTVTVSGGHGVQNGSGNVQNNTYAQRGSLNPGPIAGLNPHTAANRILKLPYDEALYLLASMSSQETPGIIAALLETDESRVVAILGDLSAHKTAELTFPLTQSRKWLLNIARAAGEISQKAAELGWSETDGLARLADGFCRKYPAGRIIWSRFHGTHAVSGEIEARLAVDETLGFPTSDHAPIPVSLGGTSGVRQSFVAGVVYSSILGTYLVPNSDAHDDAEGNGGWLGFPIAETISEPAGFGRSQQFEGGIIFSHYSGEGQVAFAVRREVIDTLPGPGRYWPVSKADPAISPLGNSGQVQRFLVNASDDSGRETAVCSSSQFGVYVVAPEIWSYYRSIGEARSWLGYPESSWRRTGMLSGAQRFEGGNIFWRFDIGAFAVSQHVAVSAVIGDVRGDPGKLGYPISEEQAIGSGVDRIQFFERGVFSLRDGKREIWLTPDQGDLEPLFSTI